MNFRYLIYFLLFPIIIFSSKHSFLSKDVHVPPASVGISSINFCTTRSSEDGSLKSALLLQLRDTFHLTTFVETGTYLGDTTIKAARIFDEVHTIELSPELYMKASIRFTEWENTFVHLGSSEEVFKTLLPSMKGRILFYLDGHYSGHITARGTLDTPILRELEAIKTSNKIDSLILIDDIRLFQVSRCPHKINSLNLGLNTYPEISELILGLLKVNPNYQFCFLGDALLAFPSDDKIFVSSVTRACTLYRLDELCIDFPFEQLKEEAEKISMAMDDEKKELGIYYQTYAPFELEYGYPSYGTLWQAFILQKEGKFHEASLLLNMATKDHHLYLRAFKCGL